MGFIYPFDVWYKTRYAVNTFNSNHWTFYIEKLTKQIIWTKIKHSKVHRINKTQTVAGSRSPLYAFDSIANDH